MADFLETNCEKRPSQIAVKSTKKKTKKQHSKGCNCCLAQFNCLKLVFTMSRCCSRQQPK